MRRRCRGNMIIEAALWIPVLVLLIVAMVQVGKVTYLYYALKKSVYSAARYLSIQQGVNFCDLAGDPSVAAALQLAVTGTTDGSGTPLISNLTTDMFTVSAQCGDGPCSTSGCPAISPRPDYIMVSMPAGYVIQPRIPLVTLDPIPLRPFVIMPFGGTT